MSKMTVRPTTYGCVITDPETLEEVSVESDDLPQLIKDLQELLPWDYNTVVMRAKGGRIFHTTSAKCPEGCRGQLEGCAYHPEKPYTELND